MYFQCLLLKSSRANQQISAGLKQNNFYYSEIYQITIIIIVEHMRNQNIHSEQKMALPQIGHSQSQSLVKRNTHKQFTLRFVNESMPLYQPSKDKFLSNYFDKQIRQKRISQSFKQGRTTKTLPSQQLKQQKRPHRLGTLASQRNGKQAIKQLSKQQFSDYLKMVRQKLQKR